MAKKFKVIDSTLLPAHNIKAAALGELEFVSKILQQDVLWYTLKTEKGILIKLPFHNIEELKEKQTKIKK